MTALPHIQYFLGVNGPTGFYSLFSELLPTSQARAIYILKGGPGCGKSTLMGQVAARMEKEGLETEYIVCSGDPDSLDAVIFPALGVAIVDGTSPHVVEPKCPGAVDRYVNMGVCYDLEALWPLHQKILNTMDGYKGHYQRAYRCLGASADIFEDQRSALLTDALSQKLAKRAHGILQRELPGKKYAETGQVKQRFLSCVTYQGKVCQFDTAIGQCKRLYELVDHYGLAHEILIHLLAGGVARGYDVVACPDPMAPKRLAHLLIPQQGVAFLSTESDHALPTRPYRRIHLDTAVDRDLLQKNRPRLQFSKKVSTALMDEAVKSLAQAKSMHDDLEELYHPYVDFSRADQIAQDIGDEILSFRSQMNL